MNDRILDISDRPARLSARGGLLVIDFSKSSRMDGEDDASRADREDAGRVPRDPESGLRARDAQPHTVPFADIAVVVVSHPEVSFTQAVMASLATAGGILIVCDEKHLPAAMMLPLSTHSTQTERFAMQAASSLPTRKRAWQQVVQAKLRAQARLLEQASGSDAGLTSLAARVRSGDPDNLEAQGARIYWQAIFGTDGAGRFRRNPEGEGLNLYLNYGYSVLRAIVARAICACGLHPSLSIHHHNRYDTFCLADDLMEPYRPLVDRVVARLNRTGDSTLGEQGTGEMRLDQNSKKAILGGLLLRYNAEGESRTLFDWISRSASSLVGVLEGKTEKLEFPALTVENREP